MIQRVQTLFMLLAAAAMGLFLYLPLINLEFGHFPPTLVKGYDITDNHFRAFGYIILMNSILAGTAIGLSLINIFLYKNRGLQMMICWFAILFIVAAQAFVYYEYQTWEFIGYVALRKWNLFTVVAVVFEILAFAFIRKDDETIKSLDRLR
jgi:hypothetical protein